mmetsp:Transcript_65560/g.109210  ORF Transcript_65560/g.109210 Transcript_65560/m.109210 type:complete len:250 (-) Transcript_65560:2926-3675(-)
MSASLSLPGDRAPGVWPDSESPRRRLPLGLRLNDRSERALLGPSNRLAFPIRSASFCCCSPHSVISAFFSPRLVSNSSILSVSALCFWANSAVSRRHSSALSPTTRRCCSSSRVICCVRASSRAELLPRRSSTSLSKRLFWCRKSAFSRWASSALLAMASCRLCSLSSSCFRRATSRAELSARSCSSSALCLRTVSWIWEVISSCTFTMFSVCRCVWCIMRELCASRSSCSERSNCSLWACSIWLVSSS